MDDGFGLNRRGFLTGVGGAAACAGALGQASAALAQTLSVANPANEDAYWAMVRAAFPLRPGLVHLNSANLAPTWRAALDAAEAYGRDICGDPSFENRLKVAAGIEKTRTALAAMLRVSTDEVAIVRNTSEANRTVISGLDLGRGDEVVIWDQNHESNSQAWDVLAERRGFKVVRVSTPANPADPQATVAPFLDACNRRTRLIAFSHVSNVSGVAVDAERLCAEAARRGILTLADGAQTFGALDLDLHRLGCDFFTASAHKWLAGPHETGVLYVRQSRIDGLWPSSVTHDWDVMSKAGARKFECLGQRQDGRIDALGVAIAMHDAVGQARAEARRRFLVAELRARLAASGKTIDFITPAEPALNAGVLMFFINQSDARAVMHQLYSGFNISALARPVAGRTTIRLCPNIYNSIEDIDIAARAVASAA